MDVLFQDSILILGVLGVLAFITNIIVEMTKDLDPIKKMPTKLYTFILAVMHLIIVQVSSGKVDITVEFVYICYICFYDFRRV